MSQREQLLIKFTKFVIKCIDLISQHAGNKGKRYLYLSSLSNTLVENTDEDIKSIVVNDILQLSDDTVMQYGYGISDSIWDDDVISDIVMSTIEAESNEHRHHYLTLTDAMIISDKLISQTPEWLRYNTPTMKKDTVDMLLCGMVRV